MQKSDQKRLEANIWKIKLNTFLMNFFVYSPILFISFQEKGISLVGISIIMALAGAANLVFEIPTGILADRWGRKYMIMLAAIAGIVSMLLWSSSIYLALVMGMMFRSLVNNAINGSDTALLYDTLVELKREDEYSRHNGQRFSMSMLAFAIAAVVASLIPKVDIYSPHFIITAGVFAIALLLATSLHEAKHHKTNNSALMHLREAFNHTRKHRETYKIVIYMMALGGSLMIILTYFQFFLKGVGVDPQYYGFIYGGLALISTVVSYYSHVIEEKIGEKSLLIALPTMLLASVLFLALGNRFMTALCGFILIEIILGLQGSVLNGYLQRHSTSEQRSTIESLKSFYQSCYQIVLYLIAGFIADAVNIGWASLFIMIVMIFVIVPPLYFMQKEATFSTTQP